MRPRLPSAIGDLVLWFVVLALAFPGALALLFLSGLTCEDDPCANPARWLAPLWAAGSLAALASLWVTRPRGLLVASIVLFSVPVARAIVVLAG